jgi:hypothetical protein
LAEQTQDRHHHQHLNQAKALGPVHGQTSRNDSRCGLALAW